MTKCPRCGKEVSKPEKVWKYGQYNVESYSCKNCGTKYRNYNQKGKHVFTLEVQKKKGFVKIQT